MQNVLEENSTPEIPPHGKLEPYWSNLCYKIVSRDSDIENMKIFLQRHDIFRGNYVLERKGIPTKWKE